MESGLYQPRIHVSKSKARRAKFWDNIRDIFDVDTNTKVDCVYLCSLCNSVIFNGSKDGNTMAFNRHVCYSDNKTSSTKRILVSNEEKDKLKEACAKFVAKDHRPYQSVECEGTIDLCTAAMQFGQKYPKATATDLIDSMPSRNVVVGHMAKVAGRAKKNIREIMDAAKAQNGLAATTDCWSDNYCRRSYMCITIHATLIEENRIKNYRRLISMDNITDLVKTKQVIVDLYCSVDKTIK